MENKLYKNLDKEIKGDQELYSYFVQRNVIKFINILSNFYVKIIFNIFLNTQK